MLLLETGSTKTSFSIIDLKQQKTVFSHQIQGFNMMLVKEVDQINSFFKEIQLYISKNYQGELSKIELYCAGCKTKTQQENLQQMCAKFFKLLKENISVYDDLLAAARAACKLSPGIVAILGTGSNSCLFDGFSVIQQVSPLGYILGDEGSGSALGKHFLKLYLRKQLPEKIVKEFNEQFQITEEIQLYNKIYSDLKPNVYLASLTKFIYEYKTTPEIQQIIIQTFQEFVVNCLNKYKLPENFQKEISFIGSVAYHFAEELKEVLQKDGYTIKNILQDPFQDLIEYYFKKEKNQ